MPESSAAPRNAGTIAWMTLATMEAAQATAMGAAARRSSQARTARVECVGGVASGASGTGRNRMIPRAYLSRCPQPPPSPLSETGRSAPRDRGRVQVVVAPLATFCTAGCGKHLGLR